MGKFLDICAMCLRWGIFIFFSIIFLLSLVIKPMYHFQDYPYFEWVNSLDIVCICAMGIITYGIYKCREEIEKRLSVKKIIVGFIVVSLIYIALVPLEAFSDMKQIYEGALIFAQEGFSGLRGIEYFKVYPNNIVITIVYGIILMIFPQSIVTLKIINIAIVLGTAIVIQKLWAIQNSKYTNIVLLFNLAFLPIIIYINHIYTDLLFVMCTLAAVYIYIKCGKKIIAPMIILAMTYFIRPIAVIFIVAVLIDYICYVYEKRAKTKIKEIIIASIIGILIFGTSNMIITKYVADEQEQRIPVWSFIYMGFNQEEFGFQDDSHDANRTPSQIIDRIKGYSAKEMLELIGKKVFWTWGEGTYQAARYGFGANVENEEDKFLYTTPITKYLKTNEQPLRQIVNSIMRSQYIILLGFSLIYCVKERKDDVKVIYLVILGTLIFYTIWEIKSRYIIHLYPFMLLAADKIMFLDNRKRYENQDEVRIVDAGKMLQD
nr:hypothetical protein [uncultured Cellulosilyticum sp.]